MEKTDHDHLGKILTYAAGLDASTVVWVAKRFTEEHRAALAWLNQHSSAEIGFFGIEIEVRKIDDSRSAPRFNVVAMPNEWTKTLPAKTAHAYATSAVRLLDRIQGVRHRTREADQSDRSASAELDDLGDRKNRIRVVRSRVSLGR